LRSQRGVATSRRDQGLAEDSPGRTDDNMRAETQKLIEEIKQSVGLLRRHL
jgi:hypothetical protein